jgi:predicted RNA-binding Zn-ribbon protein involved in translation (DUF1610 family)
MNEKLKSCEDCGHEISKRATSCPQCGAPQIAEYLPGSEPTPKKGPAPFSKNENQLSDNPNLRPCVSCGQLIAKNTGFPNYGWLIKCPYCTYKNNFTPEWYIWFWVVLFCSALTFCMSR